MSAGIPNVRSRMLIRGAIILLMALCVARSVATARDRGMDHAIQTLDFHFVAAAIAISQVYHDARGHYLGYPAVYSTLIKAAVSSQDAAQAENFEVANAQPAFRAAISLPIPINERLNAPLFVQDTPNDIGYIDFISLALSILNRDVESLYLFYFLFLSASALLFLIGHWQRLDALAWLVLAVVASNLVITQSDVFNDPRHQLHNVHDYRFVSSLAVIPALHLAVLAISRIRISVTSLLPALGQGILLALALWFRSSALWAVLGVALFWLISWIPALGMRPPGQNGRATLLVGGAALAATVLTVAALSQRIDPDYADPSLTTSYLRWHAAYVGLATDTRTWHQRKSARQVDGLDDDNGYFAAEDVIAKEGLDAKSLVRPNGGFAWRWYDGTMRRLVIDYLAADPMAALRLYLWHKPVRFVTFIVPELIGTLSRSVVGAGLVLLGLAAAGAGLAASGEGDARRVAGAALAFTFAAAGPPIFAYTLEHGMADQVFIGLWALLLLAAVAAAALIRRTAPLTAS